MSALATRRAFELEVQAPEHRWLIDGLWAEQAVGIVGGEPKSCKSFLALDMAVAVAGAVPCLGQFAVPRAGRVLLFAAEDSLPVVRARLEGIAAAAGRPLEHEWRYMGSARILWIPTQKGPYAKYYGPNGWASLDHWQLRDMHVIEQLPSFQPDHPYARKYIFVDKNLGDCGYAESYDRADELWKVWQLSKIWTEDEQFYQQHQGTPSQDHRGLRIAAFGGINVIDKQNGRGTLFPCQGHNYAPQKLSYLKKVLDVNYLSQGR